MTLSSDRRQKERMSVAWNALMLSPSHLKVKMINISSGGTAIIVPHKIPIGSTCEIMVNRTNHETGKSIRAMLKCRARDSVSFGENGFRVSAVFELLEETEQQNLSQLLDAARQEKS
jgi:hypothetical protein